MKDTYDIEINFMHSPTHIVRVKSTNSGSALWKALEDYDPALRRDIISAKVIYIGQAKILMPEDGR